MLFSKKPNLPSVQIPLGKHTIKQADEVNISVFFATLIWNVLPI